MSTSPTSSPKERIETLAREIDRHRDLYYGPQGAEVSDAEYDALEEELRALVAEHPDLEPADNPLDRVGAPASLKDRVRHRHPMLSLEKANTDQELTGFLTRTLKARGETIDFSDEPMLAMVKFDGVSLSATYAAGELHLLATRGTGTEGDDVTRHLDLIDNLPARLTAAADCEVRGEVVMLRSAWQAYNDAHPDKPLKNPRNAVSGTLGLKDPAQADGRRLRFMPFDVIGTGAGREPETLRDLGFDVQGVKRCETASRVRAFIDDVDATRYDRDYELDGVVIRLADRDKFEAAGSTSAHPRGAIAFKLAAEEVETRLVDVTWTPGKTGKLAPRAEVAPVFVAGTTITYATLANQEVIRQRDVRIGDRVLIKRAGDVIPFIVGPVDKDQRDGSEREIAPPTQCPSCGGPLVEVGNSREIYCENSQGCPAQRLRRLVHWASRAAADIDAVGEKWIERLIDAGMLERPSDFYRLTKQELLDRFDGDGMGDRLAEKMIASIDASRQVGMRRAFIGWSIPMASEGTAKRLCWHYDRVEDVAAASVDDLQRVEDVGPKVAASVSAFLDQPATAQEIADLRQLCVNLDVRDEDRPVAAAPDAPMSGMTVVVTGAITHPDTGEKVKREDFQQLCERAGAKVASSVSNKTTHLICGANVGKTKTDKAEKVGTQVMDQADAWRLLREAGVA